MSRMTETFHGKGEVDLMDYVSGTTLHKQVPADSVMVGSASELSSIKDNYSPGVVAYTAGFKNMWQLGADGNWATIVEEVV